PIALFRLFAAGPDVAAALAEFERARKPVVEEYQQAAHESRLWFENVKDYVHLAPPEFALRLMTRSKRVTYESLRRRDPAFVEQYESHSGKRQPDENSQDGRDQNVHDGQG